MACIPFAFRRPVCQWLDQLRGLQIQDAEIWVLQNFEPHLRFDFPPQVPRTVWYDYFVTVLAGDNRKSHLHKQKFHSEGPFVSYSQTQTQVHWSAFNDKCDWRLARGPENLENVAYLLILGFCPGCPPAQSSCAVPPFCWYAVPSHLRSVGFCLLYCLHWSSELYYVICPNYCSHAIIYFYFFCFRLISCFVSAFQNSVLASGPHCLWSYICESIFSGCSRMLAQGCYRLLVCRWNLLNASPL